MNDVITALERWQTDVRHVREQMYRASTPRERERWHALWLLSRGWTRAEVAEALERDAVQPKVAHDRRVDRGLSRARAGRSGV